MPAPSNYFGHQFITRKCLVSLMDFLSDIYIEKYGWDDTEQAFIPRKYVKVPIMYCARDKFLQIYESQSARKMMPPEDSDAPVEMQWILPRISVNLQGIVYDTERHINKTHQIRTGPERSDTVFAPVPYNLEVEVSTITKTLDDSFQIMEQIIPYFSPGKSLDLKLYGDMIESVPITLNTLSFDFPQEVSEDDERLYIVSYYFTIRANYYLQKKISKIIKNVNVNIDHDLSRGIHFHIDKTQTLFEQYVLNASKPNPVLSDNIYDHYPNVVLKKRGEFDEEATYAMFDLVEYEGNSFIWINQDSKVGVVPGTEGWENYWTFKAILNKNTIEYVEQ